MNKPLTLGSLFDGSGTFPMMAMLSGIVPVWKSEIEPFPIAVTEKRLPFVKHLGDINSINGAEIDPVDIITFGSPCTDLSVAGKRQGFECRAFRTFLSSDQNYQRNERCNQWKISKICSLGKMSQVLSPLTAEKTSDASSKNSVRSKTQIYLSLNLKKWTKAGGNHG